MGVASGRGDTGQPLSSEINYSCVCRSRSGTEKATLQAPFMVRRRWTRRSRIPCACVEVPSARTGRSCWFPLCVARYRVHGGTLGKRHRRYSRDGRQQEVTHGPIVPAKWANKTGTPVAEPEEGRGPPTGNAVREPPAPDTEPDCAGPGRDELRHVEMHASRSSYLREEPDEVVPHVRICAGDRRRRRFLPRSPLL